MRKQFRFGRWSALLLAVLVCSIVSTTAFAASPRRGSKNRLSGVVVSKQDGLPVAGARVVMAHRGQGHIWFMDDGKLGVSGWGNRVLWFFTKRNGRAACEARSDADGRFSFESFMAPDDLHTVAAVHGDAGNALLENVVPEEYADKELRVVLEPPGFIRTQLQALPGYGDARERIGLSLVQEQPDPETEKPRYRNVHMRFSPPPPSSDSAEENLARLLGPLPGGHTYRLTKYFYSDSWPYIPHLFESEVALAQGQTLDVRLEPEGSTSVDGRVTGVDGAGLADVNVMVKTDLASALLVGDVTDSDGRYRLDGIPPGDHILELRRHARRTGPG